MRHEAVYSAYPQVVSINDNLGAFDINGQKVSIDQSVVEAEWNKIKDSFGWKDVRKKRNDLLTQSDWSQIEDATVNKEQWKAYRKKLRDLPQTFAKPEDVVWPEKP